MKFLVVFALFFVAASFASQESDLAEAFPESWFDGEVAKLGEDDLQKIPNFMDADEDLSDDFGQLMNEDDNKNVLQVAAQLGATIFVKAAKLVGVQDVFANTPNITVFVPSNRAFARMPKNVYFYFLRHPDRLAGLLKYHAAQGTYKISDLQDDTKYNTLLGNLTLRYDSYNHTSTNWTTRVIQAAKVSCQQTNNMATNGMVHIIDEVVIRLPVFSAYDVISRSPAFSSLYNGLVVAGMSDSLKGDGPLTLFAPTERAIKHLPPGVWESLLQNKEALTTVLSSFSVVPKTTYARGMRDADVLQTLNRSNSLTVHVRGRRDGLEVLVNDARIIYFDGAVTNGVVHAIDRVIIPPSIMKKLML